MRYYLDQLYGNPVPTDSATTLVTPANHVAFGLTDLGKVFSKVFQTLAYVDGSGKYVYIPAAQADAAYAAALSQAALAANATLDLSQAAQRAQIFGLLETAIATLETRLGTRFTATTTNGL